MQHQHASEGFTMTIEWRREDVSTRNDARMT